MNIFLVQKNSLNSVVPIIRRSASNTTITNGRPMSTIGSPRLSSRNQLDPSPQELPVKDTDRTIDVAGAECKYLLSYFFSINSNNIIIIIIHYSS